MTAPEADAREYVVAYDSLCERVDRCTCAEGTAESSYAHEEGCGLEQVASLDQIFGALTEQAERDAPDQGDDPWSPAPEPVEVAAEELSGAGKPRFSTLAEAEAFMRPVGGRWVPQGISGLVMAEYDRRRRVAEQVNDDFTEASNGWALARAERDRLRAFLAEATGTLPASGFANDERGDPWVRWLERVAAYLTETHR